MSKILDLPLKAKWYEMIACGEKLEEYREIKPYWCNRLLGACPYGIKNYWTPVLQRTFLRVQELGRRYPDENLEHLLVWQYGVRNYTHVRFRYGYTRKTMTFEIKDIVIGEGKPEWGAEKGKEYFVIKLGRLI